MKKTLLFILILLSLFPLIAGGNKEKNEEKKVVIWYSSQGNALNAFEEIVDDFNTTIGKEKSIKVEAIYQGKANDVLTKVNASTSSTLPDIAMMDATAALDMNNSPSLVTIDSLGIDTSFLLESAISSYSSERGLIALPFNGSALLYYYNKTLFDSLSLEPPKTIDELISISQLIGEKDKNGNIIRYSFEGVPTTYELSYFICAQNGGTYMVNNENGHKGSATEVLFKKEGTYKAFLEKWKELFNTGFCSSSTSGVVDDFIASRTASILASASNMTKIINNSDFEVGVSRVPLVNEEANESAIISGGALYAFSQNEEVKTVLEYLISAEVQAKWSEETGYVALNKNSYLLPSYISFLEKNPQFEITSSYLKNSDKRMVNVWLPSAYTIYYSFQKNVADVVENNLDIDKAVDEMERTILDALSTYNSQN